MTQWYFAGALAVLSLLGAWAYRRLWIALKGGNVTPKGYGGALAFFLLAGAVWFGAPRDILLALGVIAVATAVYWIDDAFELDARVRFLIQFFCGAAVAGLLFASVREVDAKVIAICLLAGLLNIVLTNVVNFCDGADLNLALLPILTAAIMLIAGPPDFFAGSAIVTLAFVIPFAAVNARPKTLYFGDSGCFAFASFLTLMAVYYLRGASAGQMFAAVPMALPLFDAFYVFIIRVRNKEDLLSRNYLHLYQKLQDRFGGFYYLLPQPVNAVVVIGTALLLLRFGLPLFAAVFAAGALMTPVVYALYRRFSLQGT